MVRALLITYTFIGLEFGFMGCHTTIEKRDIEGRETVKEIDNLTDAYDKAAQHFGIEVGADFYIMDY